MTQDSIRLRQERAELLKKGTAIAKQAQAAGRAPSDKEIGEIDDIIEAAKALETSIEVCELAGDTKAAGDYSQEPPITHGQALSEPTYRLPANPVETWRASDGTQIPVLSRGQRMIDLPPSERYADIPSDEHFDIGRYLVAAATGRWSHIPEERFAQSSIVQSAGGAMVPEPIARQFIDNARARSVMFKAGMRVIPMQSGTLDIARVTGDPISSTTTNVTAENATIASTDIVLDRVQMTAAKIGQVVKASIELVNDAPNAGSMISSVLTKSFAAELDRLILDGTAAEGITGLSESTDVSETDVAGAVSWQDIMTAWEQVALANFEPSGVILGPATLEDLQVLLANGEANSFVGGPSIAEGLPKFVSTSCNTTDMFVGDFKRVLLGLRQDIEVSISTEADTAFADHQMWFKLVWRGDMQLEDPGAIYRMVGLTH